MKLSLAISISLTIVKVIAYLLTGSVTVLGDALESVVHIAAVAFSTFAATWALRPADDDHPYGHSKIVYLATGFEGSMIGLAAVFVFYSAAHHWGQAPESVGGGIFLTGVGVITNVILGSYLLRKGKKMKSSLLVSNGKHTLVDVWTSVGVIAGLVLTMTTHWKYWDGICALLIGCYILWTSIELIYSAIHGLIGTSLEDVRGPLHQEALQVAKDVGIDIHAIRHHPIGDRHILDCHIAVPDSMTVKEAHSLASAFEVKLYALDDQIAEINTHIEPLSECN